jgi:hypothetical protein
MIDIKILDINLHRNETTFRPYLMYMDLFREVGINFVFSGNRYDIAWVGQASYTDKKTDIKNSVSKGIDFVNKVPGDVMLFDGQDSASLIGTLEVQNNSKSKVLLKNTMYKNKADYVASTVNGRTYWGMGLEKDRYSIPEPHGLTQVELSGTNWLSALPKNFMYYKGAQKDIDVFAMFQYPAKESYEYGVRVSDYYNSHREKCIAWLKLLPTNVKVVTAEKGKVPIEEYYNLMSRSKIVLAAFGYGEMAPRDIEACMVGSVLIKPDMGHIDSIPFPYIPEKTYIPVNWDYSDLVFKILSVLENWKDAQEFFVENTKKYLSENYTKESLVSYIYALILNNFETIKAD